jgi:flagellar L-ring protein precursor FlgH
MKFSDYIIAILLCFLITGCSLAEDLGGAITGPQLSETKNLEQDEAIETPLPLEAFAEDHSPNSLWRKGATSFLQDQRASREGDILTVVVKVNDSANLQNNTKVQRTSTNSLAAPKLFGNETGLSDYIPEIDPTNLLSTAAAPSHDGKGSAQRSENIQFEIAAMVIKRLPNGNLFVKGEQEMMVNKELRKILVSGIVAPADIEPGNIVNSRRLSQARIYYGGEGSIQGAQNAKWGTKLLEAITPF